LFGSLLVAAMPEFGIPIDLIAQGLQDGGVFLGELTPYQFIVRGE
jgi:hypothetical protein